GVVGSDSLGYELVALPPGHSDAKWPRALARSDGRWDVLFVTDYEANRDDPVVLNRAVIWYGVFGTAWSRITKVADVRHGILEPTYASEMVRINGGLRFAYPYEANHGDSAGVVMLRETAGTWSRDPLRMSGEVHWVTLAASDGARAATYAL